MSGKKGITKMFSDSRSRPRTTSSLNRGTKRGPSEPSAAYKKLRTSTLIEPKPSLSAKELEILRRQRQVATQISRNAAAKEKQEQLNQNDQDGRQQQPNSMTEPIYTNPQQAYLQKKLQQKRLEQVFRPTIAMRRKGDNTEVIDLVDYEDAKPKTSISPLVTKHVRPTLRSKKVGKEKSTLVADALAASRSRLKLSSNSNVSKESEINAKIKSSSSNVSPNPGASRTSKLDEVRATMRKRLQQKKQSYSLNGGSTSNNRSLGNSIFSRMTPEDYWKMIRKWDFLHELNEHIQSQQNRKPKKNEQTKNEVKQSSSSSERKNSNSNASKPVLSPKSNDIESVPNIFESPQQYMQVWGPLCLQETRAQIISEFVGNYGAVNRCKYPLKVRVSSLNKDVGSQSDYITVQLRIPRNTQGAQMQNRSYNGKDNSNDLSYTINDIVILTKERLMTHSALQGKIKDENIDNNNVFSFSDVDLFKQRNGLLGQVEQSKRTPEGLCLKISKKLWTAVGGPDMYLVKIGSNITALREFMALCRFDSIPLFDNILSHKNSNAALLQKAKLQSSSSKDKRYLLANMGGAGALGKGFIEYASSKFNTSQLGAISAAAEGYGEGGFTLVKGPPGTGKTTTLVALLNSLHIRQFNKYYNEVGKIAADFNKDDSSKSTSLGAAAKSKPRLLVCAPSNAAVDNVILKIMADGFIDGNGCRYNPSMVRIGVGQSAAVKDIALEAKVESMLAEGSDLAQIETTISSYRVELIRLQKEISKLRRRLQAILLASPWPLSREWEIRIDEENFDRSGRVYFVNHKQKRTTFEMPPKPSANEQQYNAKSMPEYRTHVSATVKLVERYNAISSKLQRTKLIHTVSEQLSKGNNRYSQAVTNVRQQLETNIVDSMHIVLTTLGTAGSKILELAEKFEVVVIDEAAQSVEPSTLVGLQLGSSQAILVGDPQQLPATIFSVSGRSTKYDRSLFQRLEEGGYPVHMLDTQYRMNPVISNFPRRIFYDGNLLDGPNVVRPEYGNPLHRVLTCKLPNFQPFTILDLDSSEERGGTSLANSSEAKLALHLFKTLIEESNGLASRSRVAIITPYAQQAALLRRTFSNEFGKEYIKKVEVNTVDAFQGRESNIVIFSCVRAAGSKGIGFLSDVRRMNVALTRAKHFLFVIARCSSIVVNPYWRDLVHHARDNKAVIKVPLLRLQSFPDLKSLPPLPPLPKRIIGKHKKTYVKKEELDVDSEEDGEIEELFNYKI